MVCGVAGSGKTYFARKLSKKLANSIIVEINEIVKREGLYSRKDKYGTIVVNLRKLRKAVKARIEMYKHKNIILVGHLGIELGIKPYIFVVTRARLAEIEKRLNKRAYPKEKIRENIVSEALNYTAEKARSLSDNVYEVMTEKEKSLLIPYLKAIAEGRHPSAPKIKEKGNFLKEMEMMIKNGNRYGF